MTDNDGTLEFVRRWIESSGRAYELRIARAFRREGAGSVEQSFYYTDPVSELRREGDVRVRYAWETVLSGTFARLTAIVECKSSKKHPWVAFYDRRGTRASRLEDWVYANGSPDTRIEAPLADLWIGKPPFDEWQVATHVVAAREGDGSNPAVDAVRQVGSAADAEYQHWVHTQNEPRGEFIIAALVTAAPLYSCRLDKAGELVVEPVSQFVVRDDSVTRPRRVFVMNEDGVPAFSAALAELAQLAGDEARFRRETGL